MTNTATKNSKTKQILSLSASIAGAAFSVFLVFFMIMHIFFVDAAFVLFGFKMYVISYTGSMEPMLEYNDLVFVQNYDYSKLKEGDIITFEYDIDLETTIAVTHEIVGRGTMKNGETCFITKGINLPRPDGIVVTQSGADGTNKYIGKYMFKSVFLGNVIGFFRSGKGVVVLVVNALCVAGIYFMYKSIKNDNDKKKLTLKPN